MAVKARVFPARTLARLGFDRADIEFFRDVFQKTGGDLTLNYTLGDTTLISFGENPRSDEDKLRREVSRLALLIQSLQDQTAAIDALRRSVDALRMEQAQSRAEDVDKLRRELQSLQNEVRGM